MEKATFGRMKHGQTRLVAVERKIDPQRARMRRIAAHLHEVYKKYKAGLIKEEDLTPKQKELLQKYYGVE